MNATLRCGVLSLAALLLIVGAAGCGDDKNPETAPTLPAAQSMTMDVAFFTDGQELGDVATSMNFLNAGVRVLAVDAVFGLAMLPPSAAFAIALSTPPSRDDDGSWWWIYTWRYGGEDYQVRLRGERNEGAVDWEMYLVRPGEDPWLWYTGGSAEDGAHGTWMFYDLAGFTDREVARITWEYGGPTDAQLDFTVTDTELENVGDHVVFTVAGAAHSIAFNDASTAEVWTIEWNSDTNAGSLRVPGYNNGQTACWDGDFQDVACP